MGIHHERVRSRVYATPIPILLGPSDTGKTMLAKVATSLVGLPKEAVYGKVTDAMITKLLDRSIFFVYNDPRGSVHLKDIIEKVV